MSAILQGLLYFFLAFVVAAALVPVMIRVSVHFGWFDRPGGRKVHNRPIPRLGGVAIFISTWLIWGLVLLQHPNILPYESVEPFKAMFGASILIWILGIYDDLKGANALQKLSVQLVAAVWVTWAGLGIRLLHNPFGSETVISFEPLVWLLSIGWIVVVTNAINLIDGLDGLAGGVCFITSLTLFFISRDLGIPHLPYFSLCLAGSCLGFLIFNFSPARIFLGDSGSLFLGFILACLSIGGTVKRSTAIVMFGPPLILGLPVLDTLLAILRRFLKKAAEGDIEGYRSQWNASAILRRLKEIFQADQEHIHHALLKIGLSHRRAVIILYIVTAVLGATAYRMAVDDHVRSVLLIFTLLAGAFFWLRRRVKKSTPRLRRPKALSATRDFD